MDFGTLNTSLSAQVKEVRTRFAPSPTGSLHIGGIRTALVCWIIAKRFGGKFVLRIEDTDQKRFVETAVAEIEDGLKYFGITPDESPTIGGAYGPYVQSERKDIYEMFLLQLLKDGSAYKCYMSEEHLGLLKDGTKKGIKTVVDYYYGIRANKDHTKAQIKHTIESGIKHSRWFREWPANGGITLTPPPDSKPVYRFAAKYQGRTLWDELSGHTYSFPNDTVKDAVLMKADGLPTYHMAHVVDDRVMQMTHIVRGSEWMPSTPLHLQMWDAFGWEAPQYIHLPVILNPTGKGKLSKRSNLNGFFVTSTQIIKAGINPDAVSTWLLQNMSLLDDGDTNWRGLVDTFNFSSLPNTKPGAISSSKLKKLVSRMGDADSTDDYVSRLLGADQSKQFGAEAITVTAKFMRTRNHGEKSYEMFMAFLQECDIIYIESRVSVDEQIDILEYMVAELTQATYVTDVDSIEPSLLRLATKYGKKSVGIVRAAVTHRQVSIPAKESIELLGKDKAIERIEKYLATLQGVNTVNQNK